MGAVVLGVVLTVVVGFVALFVFLRVLTFVVSLYETRPVRFLVPAPSDDPERARLAPDAAPRAADPGHEFNPYESPQALDYASTQNLAAAALGLRSDGLFAYVKGGTYKVRYALWWTRDRRTLVVVAWGTVLGINGSKTLLYSRLQDGRVLLSCDKLPGNDTPGLYEIVVVLNAPLDVLARRHEARLERATSPAVPFDGADARADFEAISELRHDYLVRKRHEYYVDPERSAVRSTLRGAVVLFLRSWKVPAYVEKIPSPGSDPVPLRAEPDRTTVLLKRLDWLCLFLIIFPAFLSASPPRTLAQEVFRMVLPAAGVVGLVVLALLRMARKFRREG